MSYKVEILPEAADSLAGLPKKIQGRIARKIDSLKVNPRGKDRKLRGEKNKYRIRSGDYRILYEIHDDAVLVVVIAIGDRRDIYQVVLGR